MNRLTLTAALAAAALAGCVGAPAEGDPALAQSSASLEISSGTGTSATPIGTTPPVYATTTTCSCNSTVSAPTAVSGPSLLANRLWTNPLTGGRIPFFPSTADSAWAVITQTPGDPSSFDVRGFDVESHQALFWWRGSARLYRQRTLDTLANDFVWLEGSHPGDEVYNGGVGQFDRNPPPPPPGIYDWTWQLARAEWKLHHEASAGLPVGGSGATACPVAPVVTGP